MPNWRSFVLIVMGCFFSAFAATIPLSASSPQNMLQLPVERCHILWEKVITTQNFDTQFVFRLQYILFPVFGWLHIFPQGSRTGELLDPPLFSLGTLRTCNDVIQKISKPPLILLPE